MAQQPNTRLQFREAWQALQRLSANPDNTDEVFVIIRALSGKSGERHFQRYRKTDVGRKVLGEKRDLLKTLQDRDYLGSLPVGSLGRTYAEFTEREQISAAGLVAASETVERSEVDEDRRRFFDRLRDCHDLQHVTTGWGRDLMGEASVLAFGIAQAWHHGIGLIVAYAYWRGGPEGRAMIRKAWRRGKQTAWLDAADWERLLPMPLDEVRTELGLGEPPTYEPVWSEGAPAATA